ncbi:hypothetical protein BC567DRAFT_300235 [Phyllosticta citribraziliensis]
MNISIQTVLRLLFFQYCLFGYLALIVAIYKATTKPKTAIHQRRTNRPNCVSCKFAIFQNTAYHHANLIESLYSCLDIVQNSFREIEDPSDTMIALATELGSMLTKWQDPDLFHRLRDFEDPFCRYRPRQERIEEFIKELAAFEPQFIKGNKQVLEYLLNVSNVASTLFSLVWVQDAYLPSPHLKSLARELWGLGSVTYRRLILERYKETLRAHRDLRIEVERIYTSRYVHEYVE